MGRLSGVVLSAMIVAAVGCGGTAAFASSDVKAELAAKKAATAQLVKKSKALQAQVDLLKSRLVSTTKALRATEDKISDTNQRLKYLRADKTQALRDLYKDQQALGGLVSAAERYNRTSTSDLLLRAKPIDAARASLIMKSMIPALDKQSDTLKARIADMARIEGAINAQLAEQAKAHKTLIQQQADMGKLLQQRQVIYQKNEASRQKQEAEVTKLAKEARNLEDLVDKIQPRSKSVASLALPANILLPVSGTIRTGFGDKDEYGSKSHGITFDTAPGATVVTPLAGTVKFAGTFQKYKQILIVEHAGGYHSLIAGLGHIDTVVGATLAAGEPVGVADNSGADAHIYYELRQNGTPINPRKLLLAQRKQAKS